MPLDSALPPHQKLAEGGEPEAPVAPDEIVPPAADPWSVVARTTLAAAPSNDPWAVVGRTAPAAPKSKPPSALGAAARGAERGVIPAAAGMVGFGAGAELGAAAGAFGGPFAPITVPVGAVIGGLGMGYLGSWGAGKAQEAALEALPESTREAIGQSKEQQRADIEAHPYATMVGELAPNVALISPGGAGHAVEEGAGEVQRVTGHPVSARATGAALMGGQEAATEAVEGEPIDPTKVAISAGAGAFMNRQTKLGTGVSELGAGPVRAVTGGARPTAPTTTAPPETMPPVGATIGYKPPEGPPERVTILGYEDNGRGVRVQREDGSTGLLAGTEFAKGTIEPPTPSTETLRPEPAKQEGVPRTEEEAASIPFGENPDLAAVRARASGASPQRAAELAREGQFRVNSPLLDPAAQQAMSVADQHERAGQYLLSQGKG